MPALILLPHKYNESTDRFGLMHMNEHCLPSSESALRLIEHTLLRK